MKARNKTMMEISKINVYPTKGETIKANGSIGFNDAIVVSFKIIKPEKGDLFVSFPTHTYKDEDGNTKYVNDFYIIDPSLREFVTESILETYHQDLSKQDKVEEKPTKRTYKRK